MRWLPGGTSSAVHGLRVARPGRSPLRLVLRRYVLPWTADEPEVPGWEASALSFLEGLDVPTPSLVAADPTGASAGVPSVLSTRLPGRCVWQPKDLDDYCRRLAGVLPTIHAFAAPVTRRHRPYYSAAALSPPAWTSQPQLWERVLAVVREPPPAVDHCFIHRDFHAGNVLWRRGRVTGVVDWVSCCIGPPGVDVGHCRHNLVRDLDLDAADRFLATWRAVAGVATYDPYWDLLDLIDWYPDEMDDPRLGPRIEAYAARSLAELGS